MIGKSEGIVVRTTDYGEANKVLTVYTREAGKIAIMARGAKKSKSRFTAVAQLFTHGYFLYQAGSGMGSLQQGDLLRSFRTIREDLTKTAYAVYLCEFLDRMTEDREPNSYLFDTLLLALTSIDEGKDIEIIARLFEMKLLQSTGYRPRLDACVNCGAVNVPFFFSIREGGFLCHNCASRDPHTIPTGPGAVKVLQYLSHMHMNQLGSINVKPETKEQLRRVMHTFLDEYTGIRLKSRKFLEQLEKMAPLIEDKPRQQES
ncbi:DNA repair protein RecO [Aneurinibacillus sp. Ricciae_BoGa-3]|uniref:DNA repair protein RecO n=1 Tax=Aneurinibacillus sp. Ricciae_BoGa-3 TaxID=3022697 RepID=UPI002340BD86|nr:DNA repair protein RecO [Aneurinibacillus sp. Ricciae_BoGa-3]WCK53460.1 DNA repair protein RecO [Aneurinibacillus sp. Ricciae_BoGa-3]